MAAGEDQRVERHRERMGGHLLPPDTLRHYFLTSASSSPRLVVRGGSQQAAAAGPHHVAFVGGDIGSRGNPLRQQMMWS
jgi:hypothetical protein